MWKFIIICPSLRTNPPLSAWCFSLMQISCKEKKINLSLMRRPHWLLIYLCLPCSSFRIKTNIHIFQVLKKSHIYSWEKLLNYSVFFGKTTYQALKSLVHPEPEPATGRQRCCKNERAGTQERAGAALLRGTVTSLHQVRPPQFLELRQFSHFAIKLEFL